MSAKKIYYIVENKSGYKYTGVMYSNKKAAERGLAEFNEKHPKQTAHIDYGFAFTE